MNSSLEKLNSGVSLSVSVMHASFDRKRRYNVSQLISQIGEQNIRDYWAGFEVMGDMFGRGCWWNARRCWKSGSSSPVTHHMILQDDIRVCADFAQGVLKVIEARPTDVISLFCLPRKGFESLDCRWGEAEGAWGCGLIMPKELIKEFLDWELKNVRLDFKHDDSRVSLFCVKNKRTVKVPFPNLVDHLALPSTLGNGWSKPRHSPMFLEQGSPLDYDWAELEPIMRSVNSYNHYDKFLINKA